MNILQVQICHTEVLVWVHIVLMFRVSHGMLNARHIICMGVLMSKYGSWLVE
jgi:hypothetical protein